MHKPSNERAVAGHRVDDAVQRTDDVSQHVWRGVGVIEADDLAIERDADVDHIIEPGVGTAPRVEQRHDWTASLHCGVGAPLRPRTGVGDRLATT